MVDIDAGVRRLNQALRRHKPASVRVERAGAEPQVYPTPAGAKRWAQLTASIPGDIVRAEFLDPKGKVIHAMDFDGEPAGEEMGATPGDVAGDVGKLLALVNQSADVQVKRHAELQGQLVKGVLDLSAILAQRLASLEKMFGEVLRVSYEANVTKARADAGTPEEGDEGGAMVKQLLGAVGPQLVSNMMAPKQPAPAKK